MHVRKDKNYVTVRESDKDKTFIWLVMSKLNSDTIWLKCLPPLTENVKASRVFINVPIVWRIINLETPYETKCENRKLKTRRSYTTKGCLFECVAEAIIEKCKCRSAEYPGKSYSHFWLGFTLDETFPNSCMKTPVRFAFNRNKNVLVCSRALSFWIFRSE